MKNCNYGFPSPRKFSFGTQSRLLTRPWNGNFFYSHSDARKGRKNIKEKPLPRLLWKIPRGNFPRKMKTEDFPTRNTFNQDVENHLRLLFAKNFNIFSCFAHKSLQGSMYKYLEFHYTLYFKLNRLRKLTPCEGSKIRKMSKTQSYLIEYSLSYAKSSFNLRFLSPPQKLSITPYQLNLNLRFRRDNNWRAELYLN